MRNLPPFALSLSSDDDAALAADLRAWYVRRDERALGRVLERFRAGWIHRFARIRDGEEEDHVAEFIYRKLLSSEGMPLLPTNPHTTVRKHISVVVKRDCIDAWRKSNTRRKRGEVHDATRLVSVADVAAMASWHVRSTEHEVDARITMSRRFDLLGRVSARQRMALILNEELYTTPGFDIRPHAEDFARAMGESLGSVMARLELAMSSLDFSDSIRVCYPKHVPGTKEGARDEAAFTRAASRGREAWVAWVQEATTRSSG